MFFPVFSSLLIVKSVILIHKISDLIHQVRKSQIIGWILCVITKPFLTNLCKIANFKGVRLKLGELSKVLLPQDRSIKE